MAVIRPSICLLPFWEQAKSVGQFGQLKKPDELVGRDSQIFDRQLARSRSAEGAALCPSDMMLCVISYWVLSGAKRRQIQQLRCCVLPTKLLKRRDVYLKLTRHNGRAGTHGTYNPKHNDRSFNLANSEHIETVVLLSKGEIDSKKVRVEFSLEDMDMSGFQKGATYEQIKAYVLEHTGLKVSSLYISQIKRKCGLDVGQNYNLSKKEDAKVPKCPPEKEAAIRDALKYFQMI